MKWVEVIDKVEVKAKPEGIWTLAYEYVHSPALVQIEAGDGQWQYSSGTKKCSANGDLSPKTTIAQDRILPSAPVGALIAKVGGSTIGINDGHMFVVGKMCLLQLDQNTSGPLFLTINDGPSGMENNDGSIEVKISIIPLVQVPPAGGLPTGGLPTSSQPAASPNVQQPGTQPQPPIPTK